MSEEQELQCRVLGGNLIQWLQKWGPRLIQERNIVSWKEGTDKEPLVVVTTDVPGLVAANEILRGKMDQILYCRKAELLKFKTQHPDPDFLLHCELNLYFEKLDAEEEAKLRDTYHLPPDVRIAVQAEASILGPLFARGGRHLWDFSGDGPKLIEEAFETWIS
ncbi:MAG TPA: hypothetical protein VD994_16865 [Prosthecobacter sp.]|nr:hypothetical protein [Prosthecobacter sp.]